MILWPGIYQFGHITSNVITGVGITKFIAVGRMDTFRSTQHCVVEFARAYAFSESEETTSEKKKNNPEEAIIPPHSEDSANTSPK